MTRLLGLKECANLVKNKSRSNNVNSHHAISHFKHSSKERKRVSDKEIIFAILFDYRVLSNQTCALLQSLWSG